MSFHPSAGSPGEGAIPALLHLGSLAPRNKLGLSRQQQNYVLDIKQRILPSPRAN